LEVSLATFGMLEDVLLKIGGKTGRTVGEKGSGQSASLSRSGYTVMESGFKFFLFFANHYGIV